MGELHKRLMGCDPIGLLLGILSVVLTIFWLSYFHGNKTKLTELNTVSKLLRRSCFFGISCLIQCFDSRLFLS